MSTVFTYFPLFLKLLPCSPTLFQIYDHFLFNYYWYNTHTHTQPCWLHFCSWHIYDLRLISQIGQEQTERQNLPTQQLLINSSVLLFVCFHIYIYGNIFCLFPDIYRQSPVNESQHINCVVIIQVLVGYCIAEISWEQILCPKYQTQSQIRWSSGS